MSPAPRFAGIDTGDRCALAVRECPPSGPARWIYFEAPSIAALPGRCARIFDALGVEAAVIDGGPHTQAARDVHDLLPGGAFIWRHTEGEMSVKEVPFLGTARRHIRIGREALLDLLVEELHLGPSASRMPQPRNEDEEKILDEVEQHLLNLRKEVRPRAGGGETIVYGRGENHFAFAMAYACLAGALAESEGILRPAVGGTLPPPSQ